MKTVNIGIIGCGTIGGGVLKYLSKRGGLVESRRDLRVKVKMVADKDVKKKAFPSGGRSVFTSDAHELLDDPGIDIVVELIGGINPAKEFVLKAIRNGKHVVTANKALLAEHGKEIFNLARDRGVSVRFEASVGGGIPVIKALSEDFIVNKIQAVYGIINGTSNFILTKMEEDAISFREALRQAQALGIAESDPTLDINGADPAHKIAILALLGFGIFVEVNKIFAEGIENIELCDIEYARELGYAIKLLAIAKKEGSLLDIRVHPTLLPLRYLLSGVRGAQNAIYIKGDLIGDSILYGEGAGEKATSSAVISDILDLAESIAKGVTSRMQDMDFKSGVNSIKEIGEVKSRYYIRFMAQDKPGVLAKISGILAKFKISIASVSQKERHKQHAVPIVMMTHEAMESDLRDALKMINKLRSICGQPVAIRMEMK